MKLFDRTFFALDSDYALHLSRDDGGIAEEAFAATFQEAARAETRYSRDRSDGLLSSINAVAHVGSRVTVDVGGLGGAVVSSAGAPID